eukprot:TRINITY_DN11070_c0_g1_i1.p1 TRINITY_DN11070_c0_g1~~TRINITY_DN11070_c0_g1_i1.p1  ORF type:complete len:747 (+),score=154.32 TRINITY_DN11070_c0_g1_i1:137-2377(+)
MAGLSLETELEQVKAQLAALQARILINAQDMNFVSPVTPERESERNISSSFMVANADPTSYNHRIGTPGGQDRVKKIVYLVRHAEAAHNVLEAKLREEAKLAGQDAQGQADAAKAALPHEKFRDAMLSNKGQHQVMLSGKNFHELLENTHYPMPTTVLASPLRRTLMTASLLFPGHRDVRAKEFIRERRTGYPCDERQAASATQEEFDWVDLSDIHALDSRSSDGYVFREELRETYADVGKRGEKLLPFLKALDADVVAVVSHKGFCRELFRDSWRSIMSCPENLKNELSNAEVRVCEVSWKPGCVQPSVVVRSLNSAIDSPSVSVCHSVSYAGGPAIVRVPSDEVLARMPTKRRVRDDAAIICTSASQETDTAKAVEDAWEKLLTASSGKLPTIALVFGHCSLDADVIASYLRKKQPAMNVIGCSSMQGILSSTGSCRLGILGVDSWARRCGIGHVEGSMISDSSSAHEAGVQAALQATDGQFPDIIFLMASTGHEEHILSGINKVCKGVRIFGGSAANDMLIDSASPPAWQVFGGLQGWGSITDGGLVLMAIWQSGHCNIHAALSHCYGNTPNKGEITKAENRTIYEINGRPAGELLMEWTGTEGPWESGFLSQYALSFGDRLVDFKGIGENGELNCFASTAADLGRCSAELVHVKPSAITAAIKEVFRKAKKHVPFDVEAVLLIVCAGTSLNFGEEDFQKITATLAEEAPQSLAIFSFGEQGNSCSGSDAFHGNNMLNFLFFG